MCLIKNNSIEKKSGNENIITKIIMKKIFKLNKILLF